MEDNIYSVNAETIKAFLRKESGVCGTRFVLMHASYILLLFASCCFFVKTPRKLLGIFAVGIAVVVYLFRISNSSLVRYAIEHELFEVKKDITLQSIHRFAPIRLCFGLAIADQCEPVVAFVSKSAYDEMQNNDYFDGSCVGIRLKNNIYVANKKELSAAVK